MMFLMLRVDLMPGIQNMLRHGFVSHEAATPFFTNNTSKHKEAKQAKSCKGLSFLVCFV